MNDGDSAGEKPHIGFTPAVVNRRLIPNSSASLVIPISGSAVPISQMSQLPESTENTCFVDKELKLRAPIGKHGKYVLCGPSPRISVEQSDNSSQPPDNQPIQIVNADAGTSTPSIPQNTSWRSQPANSQTLTHPSSSNINNSSIQTLIVKSGNVDGNNFLKSPPPQYSSLHQTPRQIRTTQNAFVSSSSNNSVSNNCDSNSLNEISTTVTSQTGVPATIDSAEGTKTVSSTLTTIKSNQNPTTDTSFASTVNQQQSIVRKRSGSSLSSDADSINTCKKRNISYRFLRMKQIQAKHADHVAEIYFLQTGGNMMDFPTWRKKPENQRTPDYLNFSKQYQLESESSTKVTATASTTATTSAIQQTHPPPLISTNSPHGVEIKIPGVGVTPVAISKTLPAAVVQLSQLGGTPLVPDTPKQSTKKSNALSTPTNTQQTPNATAGSSNGPQEQFLKVRQEASVMQRISELQREGLWTEKRLPKLQEPQRPKAHWDYLLEEMVWLAADFAQERKWKKAAAKKCARMVQKYFSDKALAAQKAEKAKELQLKRIAGFLSKEIKIFWSNVEKLVEFKQQTKIKEKRKKALDQHLSFIVDQTEKYSQQLAVGMNKSVTDTANTSAAVSLNSSRRSSPRRDALTDDEFSPGNASSDDDEETIAKEEEEQATDTKAEIAALQRESQMDLDDLDFLSDYLKNRDKIILSDVDDDDTNAGPAKKPALRKRTADVEIKVEDDESNETHSGSTVSRRKQDKMELDSDDDSTAAEDDDEDDDSDQADDDDDEGEMVGEEADADFGLKSLLEEDENKQSQADKDDLINDAAAIAESIQPKGNTLSSTNVVTPVPFLLRHTLREYQHIGLDWLVTMHDRKLNGILADEMGLGKTIQTISLLAHLACVKGNWGPHLIVVPSSVMLNWEMEFKKWCPGFKILTYYGSQKERKQKRIGWTKVNAFHVCITSYKLVIQDHQSFRRKKWKYLILDEAQNIKNFKSQRWQLLLNFQTEQRLLLTGTPLQNNLMELWSLMHFLMPHVFQSHSEFKEWFSNPMTGMIEGNSEYNDSIIKRLHKVLRPFLLRRLKCEVEKQMPKKYEHVVMCRLSKRQRFLYDDFMSRANTRETLASGNLLSVINVLMQLRKVCNHPNMFETRPTVSPFRMDGMNMHTASIVSKIFEYDPLKHIDLSSLNLLLVELETSLSAYVAYFARKTQTPRKLIEEIDSAPVPPPKCPEGQFKMFMRIREATVSNNISTYSTGVKIGTSPAMKTEGTKIVPVNSNLLARNINSNRKTTFDVNSSLPSGSGNTVASNTSKNLMPSQNDSNYTTTGLIHENTITIPSLTASTSLSQASMMGLRKRFETANRPIATGTAAGMLQTAQIFQTPGGRQIILTPSNNGTTMIGPGGQRLQLIRGSLSPQNQQQRIIRSQPPITKAKIRGTYPASLKVTTIATPTTSNIVPITNTTNANSQLTSALAKQLKTHSYALASGSVNKNETDPKEVIDDIDTEFDIIETEEMLKERRKHKLQFLAKMNRRRCAATPMYGSDLREAMTKLFNTTTPSNHCETSKLSWMSQGYMTCLDAMLKADNWSLNQCIKSIVDRTDEMKDIFNNFVLFVPPVSAPIPSLHISHPHPSKLNSEQQLEKAFARDISPKLTLLHPIVSAMSTQFPDPRLIQYDCGKLQTLNRLLRELKDNQHRVLIFTQMTRMLDVLEAFLNYHGHIYLRLDGSTKIEQRQILMDRFNNDKRIFAFILSTRSGGVGINLTGADTVIFYDSDWNPTMDAQAQDRCHRIGQTRDVHIYRLVSEKTIEENILKKANQKRLLGDLAIEGGNFTTAYFKSSSIQELFNVNNAEDDASNRLAEVLERDKERRSRLQDNLASTSAASNLIEDRNAIGAFESALAAAEDEQDVQAAKIASAEADADLAEFDESIPIEDSENKAPELSKAEQEVENLVKQLSPIEQYAMRFVEETGGSWTAEQLRAAEAEIEQQKREWEANRLAALQKQEEDEKRAAEEDDLLTYSREDAQNQIWISDNTMELMPLWSPPTPPQDDSDLYIDYSLCFLYEQELIPESELPPVYVKKEIKRSRNDAGFLMDGRRPMKIRKEDNYFPPRSLFDRPSPALAKLRRDLKLQRYRGNFKPIHMQQVQSSIYTTPQSGTANQQPQITVPGQPLANAQPQIQTKPLVEPEGMAEWAIYEDAAILNVIQNIQGLPLNLLLLSPGHTPNWDFVADVVNQISRVYRPPKQCRYRYEAVIVPREEGKLIENPKKQAKKSKNPFKPPSPPKTIRALRTSQLFINDNNNAFTKLMKSNFDFIKAAYMKRAPQLKQVLVNPSMKNPKHAAVLSEFGVTNYDQPLSPIDIAARRAEKIKERNRNLPGSIQQQQQQQQQQQTVQQLQIQAPQIQQAQGTKITTHIPAVAAGQPQVTQQPQQQLIQLQQQVQGGVTQVLPSVATIVQAAHSLQASRAGSHQQQQQIVKVVPASPQTSNIMNTVQHVPISQAQQIQQPQHHIQSQTPQQQQAQGATQSVQTSSQQQMPTLHSVQQQAQTQVQTSQIVSIQQAVIPTSSTVVSQAASGQIVQTIPAQAATSQVVSVSQLPGVGTVFTTTSGLPSNVTTSSLRTQRIVTASVSGLNAQNVTQTQIQPSQLRLSMSGNQQVVTKGGIPMMMTTGKPLTQPTQFQIVRQNSSRQQFKVLNAGQGNTVLQTVGGQVSVVNQSGAIIQGGIVTTGGNVGQALQLQPATGQKVSLAVSTGVSGSPSLGTNVASVATVQMNSANPNTQRFMVQQRQPQVKRQMINQAQGNQTPTQQQAQHQQSAQQSQSPQQQKTQIIQQFSPSIQLQSAGGSGQQHIALVKTSTGTMATTGGMTLAQIKPGQLKATIPGVRQMQLQQIPIGQHQQRKNLATGKMTQITQVSSNISGSTTSGTTNVAGTTKTTPVGSTQLIVKNTNNMQQSTLTVQQLMRQAQPNQFVLGKRIIPVSVSSPANQRQTIQVVSAASAASGLAAGTIRTNMSNPHTIKVTGAPQQAIFSVIQQQQQMRQNANQNLRLQGSTSSLVAVAVQPTQQQTTQAQTTPTQSTQKP